MHGLSSVPVSKNCAHLVTIQRIINAQIIVFCCIHTVIAHCIIDISSGKAVCEHHRTSRVSIAPASFMVILIVGRSYMPSLIQRSLVIFIRREISAASDRSLAVSNLNQGNQSVDRLVIMSKIAKITKRGSRMIEL